MQTTWSSFSSYIRHFWARNIVWSWWCYYRYSPYHSVFVKSLKSRSFPRSFLQVILLAKLEGARCLRFAGADVVSVGQPGSICTTRVLVSEFSSYIQRLRCSCCWVREYGKQFKRRWDWHFEILCSPCSWWSHAVMLINACRNREAPVARRTKNEPRLAVPWSRC